jgi:hypothetical protein
MSSLEFGKISKIAKSIAISNGTTTSSDPLVVATTDLDGNAAVEITIVVTSESSMAKMPQGASLNTIVQIHDALLKEGDPRFPFVRYATEADLNAPVDDES